MIGHWSVLGHRWTSVALMFTVCAALSALVGPCWTSSAAFRTIQYVEYAPQPQLVSENTLIGCQARLSPLPFSPAGLPSHWSSLTWAHLGLHWTELPDWWGVPCSLNTDQENSHRCTKYCYPVEFRCCRLHIWSKPSSLALCSNVPCRSPPLPTVPGQRRHTVRSAQASQTNWTLGVKRLI